VGEKSDTVNSVFAGPQNLHIHPFIKQLHDLKIVNFASFKGLALFPETKFLLWLKNWKSRVQV
jgi:hypothetical protein